MLSIISISSIVFFGTADIRQKRTISGKANVLKAIILPFKVKFLMAFECLILQLRISFLCQPFYCMRIFIVYYNFKNIDGIYF